MDANPEDPLFQGQYEFKGKENYKPTPSFLQRVFLILDLQLSIILFLQILFGNSITYILSQISLGLSPMIVIPVCSILFIWIFQVALFQSLKDSPIKCAIALSIRAFLFYSVLRMALPGNLNTEITLFISLILIIHIVLTIYAFSMKKSYNWKTALLFIGIWAVLAVGFLLTLNQFVFKGIFSYLAILICVALVFLYGLYLVFQLKFIIEGTFFAINHHHYIFAAFILQFEIVGFCG